MPDPFLTMDFLLYTTTVLVILGSVFASHNDTLEEARRCQHLVDTCPHNFTSLIDKLQEVPDIDSACGVVVESKMCMGDNCLAAFTSSDPIARASLKVLDYLCDPVRKDIVEVVAQLSCLHDGTLRDNILELTGNCTTHFGLKVAMIKQQYTGMALYLALCSLLEDAVRCVGDGTADMCDDTVIRPVIENILKIGITERTVGILPNCFPSNGSFNTTLLSP